MFPSLPSLNKKEEKKKERKKKEKKKRFSRQKKESKIDQCKKRRVKVVGRDGKGEAYLSVSKRSLSSKSACQQRR